ncbi:MAG: indolepyruvate oxidoreductase subunit beta [Bacillota bacterium]|nr:indolepyruvate oxidoreductase subunit beta [Bacillota bacterium]
MAKTTNILIAGVGGQGTVLAAKILSRLLIAKGYDIKVSEIHGMSQRGGSVVTQVRFGEKVYSPIIEEGAADYILAFEKLEGIRVLPYLKKGGCLIVNAKEINPMPVTMGAAEYPQDLESFLNSLDAEVSSFDAYAMALEAGNPKVLNMVLLGAWAKAFGLDEEEGLKVIRNNVPEKFLKVNEEGFRKGYESIV